jgi:hypothetical protein
VVLLTVCAPVAMALFLLLMERFEAALFPVVLRDVVPRDVGQQEQPPADAPAAAIGEAA